MRTGSAPTITKDVVLLQTSDAHSRHFDMLNLTSQTVRAYCELHDFHQSVFVVLKRGSRTWHATYNRIDLLCELVDSKYRGWVLYMDADAWIADLSVDLVRDTVRNISSCLFSYCFATSPPRSPLDPWRVGLSRWER